MLISHSEQFGVLAIADSVGTQNDVLVHIAEPDTLERCVHGSPWCSEHKLPRVNEIDARCQLDRVFVKVKVTHVRTPVV